MNQKILFEEIKKKRSYLCVGLDVDLDKIPKHLLSDSDPIFSFCKKIIDSTARFAVAYKPNIAFFESYGSDGWKSLERLSDYLSINYPSIFTIADAKRADIGNTASRYAKAFFEKLSFDAVTVSPYMGRDSVEPFLNYKDKFAIVLTLTSNVGSEDFQTLKTNEKHFFEKVIHISQAWKNSNRIMYVVGATKVNQIKKIREIIPESFLLIPGIGAQGGNLDKVSDFAINKNCGIIVNSSRQIIYANNGLDFEKYVGDEAKGIQTIMEKKLIDHKII